MPIAHYWACLIDQTSNLLLSLLQLEHRDVTASQTLRAALSKVESTHPGFSYDLVLGLVRKANGNSGGGGGTDAVNVNESLLRLQGTASEQDSECKWRGTKRS